MDDLMQRIQEVLADEESMKQISEIAQQLGVDMNAEAEPDANASSSDKSATANGMAGMLGALSSCGESDKNAALIEALRPFLSEERRNRADKAMKLLRLLKLAQTLKDSGFLDSI